ncbi:HemK methyltransferase member 2 [Blyttiomyces sp. JEL0837]|nr:HemK methyltransferase member 2 [Blyttiomyces sp. JEL0837]
MSFDHHRDEPVSIMGKRMAHGGANEKIVDKDFFNTDYKNVYEPAEDTFLLLDALEADAENIRSSSPTICLEVGSGSGCVISFLAKFIGCDALYLCTDINSIAITTTRKTGNKNKVQLDCIRGSFADPIKDRLRNKVDVLLFNPPYVVTPSSEVGSKGIEAAWAGGIDGREVLDQFLPQIAQLLSPTGAFYLVTIRDNRPEEIQDNLLKQYGLESKVYVNKFSSPH